MVILLTTVEPPYIKMKTAYIIPLIILIPATSFAKWNVIGTPDANSDGDRAAGGGRHNDPVCRGRCLCE